MGNRKHHLLDFKTYEETHNSRLSLGKIEKNHQNPLFSEEYFANPPKKWEVRYDNGYPNVFYDPEHKIYRCYYSTFIEDSLSTNTPLKERPRKQYHSSIGRVVALCYAYSEDGLAWVKPELNLVDYHGSKKNNIILKYAHGTFVFYDAHDKEPSKRYKLFTRIDSVEGKMLSVQEDSKIGDRLIGDLGVGLAVSFSSDGIHWEEPTMLPDFNPVADTHNAIVYDEDIGKYVLFTRIWRDSMRVVARSESSDFIHWSTPNEVLCGNGYHDQVYSMQTFRYSGLYFGIPSILRNQDSSLEDWDRVDCELTYSSDGIHWNRICPGTSLIPRGEGSYPTGDYDCGCIYPSMPIFDDEKIILYYMGSNGQHFGYREGSLNIAYLEKDKFAGFAPIDKNKEASIITRPVLIEGDSLFVTADVGDDGYVTAELLEYLTREPIKGFEHKDCVPMKKSELNGKISWNGRSLSELCNDSTTQPYHIRIRYVNAKIYDYSGTISLFKEWFDTQEFHLIDENV